MASATHTYQSTDLTTSKRREFLSEALAGVARIRLPDGETLVALPEHELDVLTEMRAHVVAYLQLQNALLRNHQDRLPTDLGELAWAATLDDEDLREFANELSSSLAISLSTRSSEKVNATIRAWRLTANLWTDHDAVERINSPIDDDYEELDSPQPSDDESS